HLAYSHGRASFHCDGMSRSITQIRKNIFHSMPHQKFAAPSEVPGLAARRIAADVLDGVLHKHRTLDEQLEGAAAHPGLKTLSDRDRALMRHLVATILRRLGTLGHVLSRLLDRGIPTDAPRAQSALLIGAAQILWMDVPDHAAVDLSVRLVQSDRRAAKYAGLVNAVLRRCAREGQPLIDEVKSKTLDIPEWLMTRWVAHYGASVARDIAAAMSHEPSLDITVKSDPAHWATRMARLRDNLARLALQAETAVSDAAEWQSAANDGFDGVLIDAPCTSTGTIRRHPDVSWLRQEADIGALVGVQTRLLQKAVAML